VTSFLSISSQMAQVMQQIDGVNSLQDLSQLEDAQIDGLDLEGLEGLDDAALDHDALRRWRDLSGRLDGLGDLRFPDLSLRVALQEPEVHFKDNGQIIVRGYGQVRNVRQPLRLVVAPRARQGELALDFVEGNLGPVPLPEGLFDVIGQGLARVILAGQRWASIDEITVTETTLTLRGSYRLEQAGAGLCLDC
jgi:hypothetical protein